MPTTIAQMTGQVRAIAACNYALITALVAGLALQHDGLIGLAAFTLGACVSLNAHFMTGNIAVHASAAVAAIALIAFPHLTSAGQAAVTILIALHVAINVRLAISKKPSVQAAE